MKQQGLTLSVAVSFLMHITLVLLVAVLMTGPTLPLPERIDFFLVDLPRLDKKREPPAMMPQGTVKQEEITPPRILQKTAMFDVPAPAPELVAEETRPLLNPLPVPGPEKSRKAVETPKGEAAAGDTATKGKAAPGAALGEGEEALATVSGLSARKGTADGTEPRGGDEAEVFSGTGTETAASGDRASSQMRPSAISRVQPQYPEAARREGIQGATLLQVRILANGRVGDVLVNKSSGSPVLDVAAVEAVKKWLFAPARQGKEPVPAWVLLPVKFELQ